MYIYLTFLLTFYLVSGICFLYDYLDKQNIEHNHKMLQYNNIYKTVLINSLFYIPIFTIPYEYFVIYKQEFNYFYTIKRIFISIFLLDFFFYCCHSIMHIKILYRWSHKLHHKYRDSVGMEALYLHWFDLYFGNIFPLYVCMFTADLYTIIIWTFIVITSTIISHSGILKSGHNDHHKYFVYNYGLGVYMDRLLETDY